MKKKNVKIVQEKENRKIANFLIILGTIVLLIVYFFYDDFKEKPKGCAKYGEDFILVKSTHSNETNIVKNTEYFCCKNGKTDCVKVATSK